MYSMSVFHKSTRSQFWVFLCDLGHANGRCGRKGITGHIELGETISDLLRHDGGYTKLIQMKIVKVCNCACLEEIHPYRSHKQAVLKSI